MLRRCRGAAVVTALLMFTMMPAPPVAAQDELPPGGTFTDDNGSVHEGAIEAIAAAGITLGCEDMLFCPTDPVTRGQLASFIVRAVDTLDPATRDWFDDDAGSTHEANINIVAENGIVLGFGDGTYRPDADVSRGQMASFLARAFDTLDPATQDWFDDDDGSTHEANINIVAENGIAVGFGDGTFRPLGVVTRGQMATFLLRALGLTPIVPPPPEIFTAAYFLMDSLGDDPMGQGPFLVPAARFIGSTFTPATDTMEELLIGPHMGEEMSVPAIRSEIPTGTTLNSVTIEGGVATVDLSSEFQSGGGSDSMLARVAQVVFTLTQFDTVDEVDFELDGVPIEFLGGEGVILDAYNSRTELLGRLPLIYVDTPMYGGEADNPLRVTGWTAAFEAQFMVTLVDPDGQILVELPVTAHGQQVTVPGGATWTAFDVLIPYPDIELGAIIVWDTSAQDGSQIGVREYPLMFTMGC